MSMGTMVTGGDICAGHYPALSSPSPSVSSFAFSFSASQFAPIRRCAPAVTLNRTRSVGDLDVPRLHIGAVSYPSI
jgi:hypothetical protein